MNPRLKDDHPRHSELRVEASGVNACRCHDAPQQYFQQPVHLALRGAAGRRSRRCAGRNPRPAGSVLGIRPQAASENQGGHDLSGAGHVHRFYHRDRPSGLYRSQVHRNLQGLQSRDAAADLDPDLRFPTSRPPSMGAIILALAAASPASRVRMWSIKQFMRTKVRQAFLYDKHTR